MPRPSRRLYPSGLLATAVAALALVTAVLVTTAAGTASPYDAARARATVGAEHETLQRDTDAVLAAGTVGVLARARSAAGTTTAHAGTARLDRSLPIPHGSRWRIGSTTKTFVATVVLQLVGEGRLHLDDTVEHLLPGVVTGNGNDGGRITVRHLLQHTSGLFDHYGDADAWPQFTDAAAWRAHRFRTYTAAEMVSVALRHPPDFAPGGGWGYSNTNYELLAMIIHRTTGRTWQTEVTTRIIRRLDLRDTTAPTTNPSIPRPHPHAYRAFPDEPAPVDVTFFDPSNSDSAGAMIASAHDLDHFLTALLTGRLLAPPQLAEMTRTVPTAGDVQAGWPGSRYGLGLMWFPTSCGGYWGHAGDTFGFVTRTGVTADTARGFTVMTTTTATERTDAAITTLAEHTLCPHRTPPPRR
ncbi:serine hydrolase domain-containing protein [Embleya hyalina]|uniref:Serine hydrolase n=1 Tax=Embleya hyalina TaxID=516124 RepID=A0A401YF54_9ACTN|nr:serine hydrolase domain-containing protein [Embleya hyalina]GCD93235.1 serine hydrolase [Embleya hyalina]